ncbi:3-dehydroquinate synthase [Tumebacillus algifaecis]|uniref:3-dehydroquinate synthase n=1 Tax=Tumebacillus algifaecis TaxID=1214604 RepID=A0A223D1U0_9BACL|nr:3-dehydroquinate synthase [Tumebacillus algifaecis]ASS75435.1 3-dehydroquinate synthase [Tumebacillus algifaecis]
MIRERVDTGHSQYDIVIGTGLLAQIGQFLQELNVKASSRHLIITDTNVQAAGHLSPVLASLQAAGYRAEVFVIPAGEASKRLELAEQAFEFAYEAGLDRHSVVLALGGGVVGDFAGFVAAAYMRGISFVQLPTTLLAHDSAVGGKVAVNLSGAKNIIGAFHQPLAVIYDIAALQTLPIGELRSGFAEAIKHGIILDAELFAWMTEQTPSILQNDPVAMGELLARSCRIKAGVVSADEQERGLRAILNFGHTLGHAVETLAGSGHFRHGEAVAIGMVAAAELSVNLGYCAPTAAAEVEAMVERAGLPTRIPAHINTEELIKSMQKDKKASGGTLTFVLLCRIGEVEIVKDVPPERVREVIASRRER